MHVVLRSTFSKEMSNQYSNQLEVKQMVLLYIDMYLLQGNRPKTRRVLLKPDNIPTYLINLILYYI